MKRNLWLVVFIAAVAGLIAAGTAHAVLPGVYTLTIKYLTGQHQECERMNGRAEATIQDGSVKSSLVRSLRLTIEPDGVVTGFGYESMTGHGAAMHLKGKQTSTGFEGTAGLERWGYLCSISWSLARPGAVPAERALGAGDSQTGAAKDDVRARLNKVKQLFDDGLITKEEYDIKRRQLLDLL